MSSISAYFDIHQSFPFYGAYHKEWRNILVHVIGVPTLFTTGMYFFTHLKLIPDTQAVGLPANLPLFGNSISVGDFLFSLYTISFYFMEPVAAALYTPFLIGMHQIANSTLQGQASLAIGLHVIAWIAQFIGHGVFEGRKPALLDSFFQSIHAAVFFVWLEVLFYFGYRPALQKELEHEMKQFAAKENNSKKKKDL